MADANEPGSGVVPSARAEQQRAGWDDVSGIVLYATAVALISFFIVAVVLVA
jgi:hypothetical protein